MLGFVSVLTTSSAMNPVELIIVFDGSCLMGNIFAAICRSAHFAHARSDAGCGMCFFIRHVRTSIASVPMRVAADAPGVPVDIVLQVVAGIVRAAFCAAAAVRTGARLRMGRFVSLCCAVGVFAGMPVIFPVACPDVQIVIVDNAVARVGSITEIALIFVA